MLRRYRIGEWEVRVELRELWRGDERRELEPRTMSVLQFLLLNPNRPISRDELVESVWDGSIVSDSTINWTIAQLRKALDDTDRERRYLRTLSKHGYQWIAAVETIEVDSDPQRAATPVLRTDIRPWLLWGGLGAALVAAVLIALWPGSAPDPQYRFRALSAMPGTEAFPAFSADGRWLAFVHRQANTSVYRVYIRRVAEGGALPSDDTGQQGEATADLSTPPRPVGETGRLIRSPDWSPNGQRLAWIHHDGQTCSVRLVTFDDAMQVLESQTIASCHARGYSQLAWSDRHEFLYLTDSLGGEIYQLFLLNVLDHSRQVIGDPPSQGLGDLIVRQSPQDNRLLLVRDRNRVSSEFRLYDPDVGTSQLLFTEPGRYLDASWSADGEAWLLNRGQQHVYRYQLESGELSLALDGGLQKVTGLRESPLKGARVFVKSETNSSRIEILELSPSTAAAADRAVIDSSYGESLPRFSPTENRLAFVSDRSGLPQVWTRHADTDSQQITTTSYHHFSALSWSQDGQSLVGASNGQIISLALDRDTMWLHSPADRVAANAVVSSDGRTLYFALQKGNGWALASVPYENQRHAPTLLKADVYYLAVAGGRLLYAPRGGCGLYEYGRGESSRLLSEAVCVESNSLTAVAGQVFFERFSGEQPGIYRFTLDTRELTLLVSRRDRWGHGFSVSADGKHLALQLYHDIDSELVFEERVR